MILGSGGYGKVVADIAKYSYDEVCFIDDSENVAGTGEMPVVGSSDYAIEHKDVYDVFVAIGNSKIREKLQEDYIANDVAVVSLIHPLACVAEDVIIGNGTVVMAGAVINSGDRIGNGVIVNTGATVDHDCCIEDYVHVSIGSHVAGTVNVGKHTWIGAGAVVRNNINICEGCMIGAGAVVVEDIEIDGTYLDVLATTL